MLFLSITSVQANVGFGLTNTQAHIIMGPDMDRVCNTYFLYNPGDIDITGFLDIDREGGGTLNKLLGLDPFYEELDKLDSKKAILQEELDAIPNGESTFRVEKKLADLEKKINSLNEEIEKLKPTKNTIPIPAHTRPVDENGNYQIPVQICFNRPMRRYLLSKIGDTNFCGTYKGEVIGRYLPVSGEGQATGSAIAGSRSAILTVQVRCSVYENSAAWIKLSLYALVTILIIGGVMMWKKKKGKSKNKRKKRKSKSKRRRSKSKRKTS